MFFMRKVISKQKDVDFVFCPYPMTIDKSADWGEGNIQVFPNGVFLKRNKAGIITHGVQPNQNGNAPVGWVLQSNGFYTKQPIWYLETLEGGRIKKIKTLDGTVNYKVKNRSVLVAQDKNNHPDLNDTWIIDLEIFNRDYHFQAL